jgi:hypothetical protein
VRHGDTKLADLLATLANCPRAASTTDAGRETRPKQLPSIDPLVRLKMRLATGARA